MTNEREMRTPIEVLLGMDENNMVSAKKLYEFLELAPTQYARWCKDNIIENPIVEEGDDYYVVESRMVDDFRHNVENPTEYPLVGGRPFQDYMLTIDFAKELCMTCKTVKGKQARNYFKKTEKALVVTVKQYNELVSKLKEMTTAYSVLENKIDSVTKDVSDLRLESHKVSDFTKRNEPYYQKIMDYYRNSPSSLVKACADKDLITNVVIGFMEEMDARFKYEWAMNEYRTMYHRDVPRHKYHLIDCLPEYHMLFTLALAKYAEELENR